LLGDDGKMLSRSVSNAADSAFVNGGLTGVRVAMVAGRWPDPTGEIRLIRNDNKISGHDPDGDGLGSRLETSIGTCSSLSSVVMNFECSRAHCSENSTEQGLGALHFKIRSIMPSMSSPGKRSRCTCHASSSSAAFSYA
jgi:hypothetical protein